MPSSNYIANRNVRPSLRNVHQYIRMLCHSWVCRRHENHWLEPRIKSPLDWLLKPCAAGFSGSYIYGRHSLPPEVYFCLRKGDLNRSRWNKNAIRIAGTLKIDIPHAVCKTLFGSKSLLVDMTTVIVGLWEHYQEEVDYIQSPGFHFWGWTDFATRIVFLLLHRVEPKSNHRSASLQCSKSVSRLPS